MNNAALHIRRLAAITLPMLLVAAIAGCSGMHGSTCDITAINVDPPSATADHNAAPPGNSKQFFAFASAASPGCAVMHSNLNNVTWSVSDTVHVSISNVHDQTYGVATCMGATTAATTITAIVPSGPGKNVSATATLSCL
ncbi:MAG: hypothetical protein DMG67_16145 [Acidobacteria bacterium]|nr:MAG: hypothetical protein DMG67_16145 [Acidobacteriota bacterium]